MKEQLTQRIIELQAEYDKGQEQLTQLEEEIITIRSSVLRISGAIQVLQEELDKAENAGTEPELNE